MEIIKSAKFQLVKGNIKELKNYLFNNNDINDWRKIIIVYNFYLFFSNLYIAYHLIDVLSKGDQNFITQFRNVYLFFFILCSVRTSYMYLIINISKIDATLGNNLYNNTKEYFM
jgi:hypothetical protein